MRPEDVLPSGPAFVEIVAGAQCAVARRVLWPIADFLIVYPPVETACRSPETLTLFTRDCWDVRKRRSPDMFVKPTRLVTRGRATGNQKVTALASRFDNRFRFDFPGLRIFLR